MCKVNEDVELLFTLFDGEKNRAITENYLIKWNRLDIDIYFKKLRALFTDLSSMDLHRNKIYLVAYVIRNGAMDGRENDSRRLSTVTNALSASKRNSTQSSSTSHNESAMRRPFGVAAIDLTLIIKKPEVINNDTQLEMPFFACDNKDTLDGTLQKIFKAKENINKEGSNIYISVELLHGDLKQLKEEYPHLIVGNMAHARKLGFPEVIFPGDVRNDLYVTLLNGEFSKSTGKTCDKNIEVSVSVCNELGEMVKDVITQGGGAAMTNEYHSVIYYHDDKPIWNETFKINVPIEEFIKCHLKFTFKHRSSNETKDKNEKIFGLSFVKLQQDNGTTLQQNCHSLVVYKIDHKKYEGNQFNYYTLPSRTFELLTTPKPQAPGFSLLNKDSFKIDINLCSTKLTQDVDLLGLLRWSSNPEERLEESLVQLLKVSPEEIVKFLQDILDALFEILVGNHDPLRLLDDLVFQCLLMLIEIVSDKKYQHFQSVLDLYINKNFSSTLAYDKLINVLERHFLDAFNCIEKENDLILDSDNPAERKLYKTIKNLQYIMKFIIRSRQLYAEINKDDGKYTFETRLEELMGLFVQLIQMPNPLLRSQGAIFKYLHVIASDLIEVYDPLKLR